jgi:hypothetical protein
MRGGYYGYGFCFDVFGVKDARSDFFTRRGAVGGGLLCPFVPLVDMGEFGFGCDGLFARGKGKREDCGE